MSGLMAAVPEENGFVVKSEPFDPSYEMGDLLLNGSVDSIMDMPLFNEVDSLMNIKHEDHLNDTVFYLPMSYPLHEEAGVKAEVDSVQVAEATRTLANELALPNALLYVRPDTKPPVALQQADVKQEVGEAGSPELRAHLKAAAAAAPGGSQDALTQHNGLNGHQHNGYKPASKGSSSRKAGKKGAPPQDTDSEAQAARKVNGARGRQAGSSSSNSESSGGEEEEEEDGEEGGSSSPPPHLVQHTLVDDRPEIDRFVICSDHTMECVLCAFTTDSYSAFKSHIICSHPAWRITKKLSKNRLLVERSIKSSGSTVAFGGAGGGGLCGAGGGLCGGAGGGCVCGTAGLCGGAGGGAGGEELRTTKGGCLVPWAGGIKTELHKVLRKYDKNPRKRQLFERNKRLFKCTICLRLFVFEGSVVNHVTDQHGLARPYDHIHISNDHGQRFGPIYRCSHKSCYFSCESEKELERHSLDRHTQVMYRCQLCGYTADSAEAVRTHGICMHQQQLMCFDTPPPPL